MVSAEDRFEAARSGMPLPEQRALLEQALVERGVAGPVVAAAMALVQDGFCLMKAQGPTRSRVGGSSVVLPTGESWPMDGDWPLSFLFELYVDDFVGAGGVEGAARGGALLVFHDEDPGSIADTRFATRVLFRRDDDPGVRVDTPDHDFQPRGQVWLQGWAVPSFEADAVDFESLGLHGVEAIHASNDLSGIWDQVWAPRERAQALLGAPDSGQGPLAGLIEGWFSLCVDPDLDEVYTPQQQKGEGWRLLLQPDDVPELFLDWSIAGRRFHVVPEEDLASGRYDRAITVYHG